MNFNNAMNFNNTMNFNNNMNLKDKINISIDSNDDNSIISLYHYFGPFVIVFEHKSGISNYSHIRFANSADQEIFLLFISDSHITIYKDKQNDANLSYTSDYHNKRLMLWFCLYGNTYKLKLNKNGAEVSRTFSPNTIPIRKISFTNWQYKTELIAITNEFFDLDGPKHVYIASDFMK